jgi:hypothetical protein
MGSGAYVWPMFGAADLDVLKRCRRSILAHRMASKFDLDH